MRGIRILLSRWTPMSAACGLALTCALGFWGTPAHADTQSVLYSFSGADGATPVAGVIEDKKGNLYGTTTSGGAGNDGAVYELSPPYEHNNETVLYSFSGGIDGSNPEAGLIMDKKGNLYGTTTSGGASNNGVVFELSPPYGQSSETVLYAFSGGADGANPRAGLIMDKKGNLYGTTASGDASNAGVVFELSPPYGQSSETVLYSFSGGTDGKEPAAGVIMDKKGNLYGTTFYGGTSNSNFPSGAGVVFKLSRPYGQNHETVLYSFTGGVDGGNPYAGVILKKGHLYGTTGGGGDIAQNGGFGWGVVFELSSPYGQSHETVLYSFSGGADGAGPEAGVIIDKNGNLYGTTNTGGSGPGLTGSGVVFELSNQFGQGSETVLFTFTGATNGSNPGTGGVIMDKKGHLFGTTASGGASNLGVVFEMMP